VTAAREIPIGIRLNNPCNIEISNTPWLGKISPSSHPPYEEYDTAANGIRNGARNFLTSFRIHGNRTVLALIKRHAPKADRNPTEGYAAFVAKALGVGVEDPIDLERIAVLEPFVTTVIRFENGEQPYEQDLIHLCCIRALA
jgi:hypothetical protein